MEAAVAKKASQEEAAVAKKATQEEADRAKKAVAAEKAASKERVKADNLKRTADAKADAGIQKKKVSGSVGVATGSLINNRVRKCCIAPQVCNLQPSHSLF